MPFNPAQFVFQPRPLQSFDISSAFKDLADARLRSRSIDNQDAQAKATLGQRKSEQGDANSLSAATMANARDSAAYESQRKDYEKANQVADAMRKAGQARDFRTVEALAPTLLQMGGKYSRSGDDMNPVYEIEGPNGPQQKPLDAQGMRDNIFGGGGPSGQTSQPFQMRSNIGPGSGPNVGGNPFERLPGASAAAMPPAPSAPPPELAPPPPELAGPPTGPAPGSAPVDPAQDPQTQAMVARIAAQMGPGPGPSGAQQMGPSAGGTPDEQQAPSGEPPVNLTGPNPYNPQTFSPYRIDTGRVKAENQERGKPYFEGMQKAVPGRFGERMRAFTQGASELGYSPEDTLKLTQPQLQEMTGLWRGELAAEGQAGRLALQQGAMGQREDDRRFANDLKLRDRAVRAADKIVQVESLTKSKDKYLVGKEIEDLLASAEENPNSANALIEKIYYANNTGMMTDSDYTRTEAGITSLWQSVKNHTVQTFLKEHGGLNPDTTKTIRQFLDIAMQGHRRRLMSARDGLYRIWKNAKTQVEKDAIEDKLRGFFSEEFYPAEFNDGISPGENMGPGDEPAAAPPPAGDNLGRAPLPSSPQVSPNGVPFTRGSRVPAKPARNPKKLTDAQLDDASEDELMEMLRGAASAP